MTSYVQELFDAWDAEGIVYCHWKSNEHLQEGLNGKTDLDILVAQNNLDRCRDTLRQQGWIFAVSTPFKVMEHWIGFEEESGTLFHIHMHSEIPVGPTKHKRYTLPVSNWLLENRVRQDDIWVASPETELFMLAVRIALKTSVRQVIAGFVKQKDILPKNIRTELDWLLKKIDKDSDIQCPVLLEQFSSFVQTFLPVLKDKRPQPFSYGKAVLQVRFLVLPYFAVERMFLKRKKGGKTLEHAAPVIAFIGVDGSGKSTAVEKIRAWLSWKFCVCTVYLGSPKRTLCGKVLLKSARVFHLKPLKFVFRLYAAWYRLSTAKKVRRIAQAGCIVLADRWPTPLLWKQGNSMDGPKTEGFLGVIEQKIYRLIPQPDYFVVLKVSEHVLHERDSTISDTSRSKKVELITSLDPRDSEVPLHIVDAEKDLDVVLLECKRLVFNYMRLL